VDEKVRERLSVSKRASQKFDVERFNLKKVNDVDVREEHQIQISKRSAALESLNDTKDTNRAWENIKESIRISAKDRLGLYEWKQHKPCFDKECSNFLDQRKQAKIQWLQIPEERNAGNLNNVRHEAGRHFRNKRRNNGNVY
jgi:hypothetical protein